MSRCKTCLSRTKHVLSSIDEVELTATCTLCGPTVIRESNRSNRNTTFGKWRCVAGYTAGRRFTVEEAKERRRWSSLWGRHKLTKAIYLRMVQEQDDSCAICKDGDDNQHYDVDHDHACCPGVNSCGKCIRGLLCPTCNKAMGLLRDDPNLLRSGINYIERYDLESSNAVQTYNHWSDPIVEN